MSTSDEPLSGKLGNTKAGEPYDAGNMSGIPPEQSNISQPSRGTDVTTTNTQPQDASSTASRSSDPRAAQNAVSSAGRNDHDAALEGAGGIHDADRQQLHEKQKLEQQPQPQQQSSEQSTNPESGPPAQKLVFTKAEIDDAAHVTSSRENPHTIGMDGREQSLEEAGGFRSTKDNDGGKGGLAGHGGKHGHHIGLGHSSSHGSGSGSGSGKGNGHGALGEKLEHLREKVSPHHGESSGSGHAGGNGEGSGQHGNA